MRDFFDVDFLSPTFDAVPEDADLLLLVAPGELNQKTAYAIDQYALAGKPVIVFADPYSEVLPADRDSLKANPLFTALLAAWGTQVEAEKVVGDIDNSRQVQFNNQGQPAIVNYLPWLAMPQTSFDRTDGIFNQISSLLLASAGALSPVKDAGTSFQPLVASSPRSAMIDVKQLRNPDPIRMLQSFLPDGEQRVLAARLRGNAVSSFKDGRPEDAASKGEHVATGPVNVLAVSDADMLFDSFWAEVGQSNGRQVVIPRAGNAQLPDQCHPGHGRRPGTGRLAWPGCRATSVHPRCPVAGRCQCKVQGSRSNC